MKFNTSVETYLGEISNVLMSLDIDKLITYPRGANRPDYRECEKDCRIRRSDHGARVQENVMTEFKFSAPHDACIRFVRLILSLSTDPKQSRRRLYPKISSSSEVFLSMRIFLSSVSNLNRSRRRCCQVFSYNTHVVQRKYWDPLPGDMQDKVAAVCDLHWMGFLLLRASDPKRCRRQCSSDISSSSEETQETNWDSLPEDVQHNIWAGLPLRQVFQFQSISKSFLNIMKRPGFLQSRLRRSRTEGKFSPMVFFIDPRSGWHWLGFDLNVNEWKRLPSLSFLATPDANLFKEFLVAGSGGLLCVNVSKQPGVEQIIICNPLTRDMRKLPPMNFPRQPVLINLILDKDTNNYKVIVAGSATIGSEELSRKTEVYDSITGKWKVAGDVPGPEYALNEFQTGALSEGVVYCVGFISTGERITHGLLAYDVETQMWFHNWECTLPRLPCCQHVASNTTQLFESEGSIFVYWEQEHNQTTVHFCVAKLEVSALSPSQPTMWSVVVSESRMGSRGLLVYPEYFGIGHGHGKVCIFNTLELSGSVYRIGEGISVSQPSPLEPMPTSLLRLGGSTTDLSKSTVKDRLEETASGTNGKPLFFPLNALTFTFEPSFHTPVL